MSQADKTQEQLKMAIRMAAKNGGRGQDDENARPARTGGPRHPIPSMQGPFEESIDDASNPPNTREQEAFNRLRPKQRRQRLLDSDAVNGTYNEQWRSKSPNSKFHPFAKIISQIAFGVHLLHQQLAKSDEEVVKILQKHVDDVDNFVQRGEEDLELAIADVRERINYLKLPLEHVSVFDVMLDDKAFRTSILNGNEKIEKVVTRTANYVKDLQVDVQKAMESTVEMGTYLDSISDDWPVNDRGSVEIFRTMQANVEGWVQALSALQMKGNGLSVAVVQLGSILNEMAKRAGSASRREQRRSERVKNGSSKSRASLQPRHTGDISSKYSSKTSKPLPADPDLVARVVEATLPNAKLPSRERERKEKHHDSTHKATEAPKNRPASIKSAKSAKSTTSTKSKKDKKPPPIRVDKMPPVKRCDTATTESTKRSRMTELANVFRFHGSAAPSPLTSPTLPPPTVLSSMASSPYMSPLTSPKLPQKPPRIPEDAIEMEAAVPQELENEAQSALIEARSRLRKQSQEALNAKRLQATTLAEAEQARTLPNSSNDDATDSAYASSPELEQLRPKTSPNNRPSIGGLGNFPSASVTSFHSVVNSEQGASSSQEILTALPPVPAPAPASVTFAPSPPSSQSTEHPTERRTSVPALPSVRKSTSLTALRKLFHRGRSASEEPRIRRKPSEEKVPLQEIVGAAKKTPLPDVFELPG